MVDFLIFILFLTLFGDHERSTHDFLIAQSKFFTANTRCCFPSSTFPRKEKVDPLKHSNTRATHSRDSDLTRVVCRVLHTCNAISPISVTAFSYHFARRPKNLKFLRGHGHESSDRQNSKNLQRFSQNCSDCHPKQRHQRRIPNEL